LVWLIYPTAYSFVMISPNLLAIWVFLFLNLSQDLIVLLLRYFGTLGEGELLQGSHKKPSRHRSVPLTNGFGSGSGSWYFAVTFKMRTKVLWLITF